jgi:hypothetical protein
MVKQPSTLTEIARSAYENQEADRKAERKRQDEALRLSEENEDIEALARIADCALMQWFPNTQWELVDRRLPQGQVIVKDVDSGLMFKATPADTGSNTNDGWHFAIVTARKGGTFAGRYNTFEVRTIADVGRYLQDRERRQRAVELSESRGE